jgi:hypothetical protein
MINRLFAKECPTVQQQLTYLLTYSMVQSPSWAANGFAASQEIPRISRKPNVRYRTHKRTPPVSILGQSNPVRMPTSHLLEIHPNIIHPSTPRSTQWSPSLRFPHQDPIYSPLLTHTCHMPSPSHCTIIIIIIIIINSHSLLHSRQFSWFSTERFSSAQALHFYCSVKTFLTVWRVLNIHI